MTRLFSAATKTWSQDPRTFYTGMVYHDYNYDAVFAQKEETLMCDPNIEEKEETFCTTI